MQKKIDKIIAGLQAFFKKNDFQKAVIGLSGGVDSALTAKLAVMALGNSNVMALILPHEGVSDPIHTADAENYAKELGIRYAVIPINEFEAPFEKLYWGHGGIAQMNIKARIRANVLYHWANTHGALVLGTGNKTEETLGYFTKYGDGACDVLPIATLYKTQVWQAARLLNLPENIIQKAPTAELAHGQTDEGEIGMTYAEIDAILQKFEAGHKPETSNEQALWQRIQTNRHKSHLPPIIES